MSARIRAAATVTAGALLVGALAGCSDGGAAEAGTTGSAASAANAASASCPNGKIRMGVEPFEDPAKLEPAFRTMAAGLSKKLDCPVDVSIVEDYSAEVLAMENGKLDMAVLGPLGFVFASRRADAQAVASFGLSDGSLSSYTAGIWVPKDSSIKTVADLKGHSFALGSTGSTSGDALPRYAIQQAGLKDTDIDENYAGGHPEAMLALVNGTVDAAEVNSQTQATATREGTFDATKFRQIWKSDAIPNDPVTVAGKLGPDFQKAVQSALLDLDTADVEQIGKYLDVDPAGPLVKVDKTTYQPLFDLADTLGLTEKDAG